MREIIVTGASVEEATEKGCAELGLSRLEVSVEIIELPRKKWFKTIPAKVRVSEAVFYEPKKKKEKPPVIQEKVKKAPSKKEERIAAARPKKVHEILKKGEAHEDVEIGVAAGTTAELAINYITEILTTMGASDIVIRVFDQGEAMLFKIESELLSSVLDVNGDFVQSLSYLVDRSANRNIDKRSGDYLRVRIDISGYRDRRETELLILTQKIAEEVLKTKRSRTLAPMNSYERLIVHTAISEIEGLVSESKGEDVDRRVVIRSTAADATDGGDWKNNNSRGRSTGNNRGVRGGKGGNNNRGNANRDRNSRPSGNTSRRSESKPMERNPEGSKPIIPERKEAVADGKDVPLYGKIEF